MRRPSAAWLQVTSPEAMTTKRTAAPGWARRPTIAPASDGKEGALKNENREGAGLGLAILFLLISTSNAAAADSANGQRLAERWCAECHVIASGQQRASDAVPAFAQIGGHLALALRDCGSGSLHQGLGALIPQAQNIGRYVTNVLRREN